VNGIVPLEQDLVTFLRRQQVDSSNRAVGVLGYRGEQVQQALPMGS